jgi:hypothetical protein
MVQYSKYNRIKKKRLSDQAASIQLTGRMDNLFFNGFILNTEPLTSLSCHLNAVFHFLYGIVPQDAETPLPSLLQICLVYNFNCSA